MKAPAPLPTSKPSPFFPSGKPASRRPFPRRVQATPDACRWTGWPAVRFRRKRRRRDGFPVPLSVTLLAVFASVPAFAPEPFSRSLPAPASGALAGTGKPAALPSSDARARHAKHFLSFQQSKMPHAAAPRRIVLPHRFARDKRHSPYREPARPPRKPRCKMQPSDESRLFRPRLFDFRETRSHDALVCLDARLIERVDVGKFAFIGD